MRLAIWTAITCIALSNAVAAQELRGGTEADYQAIRQQFDAVITNYNASDVEGLKSVYTDDAWHVSIRRPPAVGREAIGAFFEPNMKNYSFETNNRPIEIEVSGDTAHMMGRTTLAGVPKVEGPPAFSEDRFYFALFRREADGVWRIARYVSTNSPTEETQAPAQ